MVYDCIVIGKGLIGSAAAKYLSLTGKKTAVIGPDEPLHMKDGIVFSSHYDQARIQRIVGADTTWTLLNQQSAKEYPSLQKESGINFHTPVGCLYVNPYGSDTYLEKLADQAKLFNSSYSAFESSKSLNKLYPDFHFPRTSKGILEESPAGYINPRLLIRAQVKIFKKNNGTEINDIADRITYQNGFINISTLKREDFTAKKVLVATGAFTNFLNLLNKKLAFYLKSETTICARVDKQEATRLKKLPCLLYEIDNPEIQNIYLIQPVLYPGGHYYLKMGSNIPEDIFFENLEDVQGWFRSADNGINLTKLSQAIQRLMPHVSIKEFATKKCIVTRTIHKKPYIGAVNEKGLFVAAGGNGYSAMCSDALGRLAASVIINETFPREFCATDFLPTY